MAATDISSSLPSWYITEKETANTIQKLAEIKELAFYLENPDPFVRRLAIIRTGQLMRKESYMLLQGILEDNLETEENHKLAAIFMNKLNNALNLGFFVTHRYMRSLSNEDEREDLLEVKIVDTLPNIKLNFESSLIASQLNFDNEFLRSNIDESDIVTPFSVNDWMRHISARFLLNLRKGVRNLIGLLFTTLFIKGPKQILSFIASLPKKLKTRSEKSKDCTIETTTKAPRTKSVVYSRKKDAYHLPVGLKIKSAARMVFRVLFLPFRVLFRFKWAILATIVTMYCIFSFTTPGQSFLFRINPKAYFLNTRFLSQAQGYIQGVINSNEPLVDFLGRNTAVSAPMPENETFPENTPAKKLIVTASKGLYLRTEPKSNGNRLVLMKQNTTVEFLGQEKLDSAGSLWYKVRIGEETGWANAQFLKEV